MVAKKALGERYIVYIFICLGAGFKMNAKLALYDVERREIMSVRLWTRDMQQYTILRLQLLLYTT